MLACAVVFALVAPALVAACAWAGALLPACVPDWAEAPLLWLEAPVAAPVWPAVVCCVLVVVCCVLAVRACVAAGADMLLSTAAKPLVFAVGVVATPALLRVAMAASREESGVS